MSVRVTVALIGDPVSPSDLVPIEEWRRAYATRPARPLDVALDETLDEIYRRVAEDLGVSGKRWRSATRYGIWNEADDVAGPVVFQQLPVVRDDGRLRWTWDVGEVTLGQLRQSVEIGALHGDPDRIYAALVPSIGDGFLPLWAELAGAFKILVDLLDWALRAQGVASWIRVLRDRTGRAQEALDAGGPYLTEAGIDPYGFDLWLDDRPWLPADIAPLLGCTPEHAEGVLWAYGFAPAPSGLWRREADKQARFLEGARSSVITTTFHHADERQVREYFELQVRETVETGQPPKWDRDRFPGE